MQFFFQVELPEPHPWGKHVVVVFACTACASSGSFIPEMVQGPLLGAVIPEQFLRTYQTNFRFVIGRSEECVEVSEYRPRISRKPLSNHELRIGQIPSWHLGDETPGFYGDSEQPVFLFQTPTGLKFERLPEAPPQKTLDIRGKLVDSNSPLYKLFLGNAAYYFGFGDPLDGNIYVVTQT